jgi:rod shape-determining protein MreC
LNELLRRFHYPLTYLLLALLCVTGMTSQRRPAELGVGSQLLVELTVPLQRMVTLPVRELRSLWAEYISLVLVREENDHLRGELARVKEENLQYREAIVASERFQRLAGVRERHEVPMVPANVAAQDLSSWFQSLIIDQGSTSGVRPGMPVITDSGVVGVVAGTTPRAAKVLLISDPQSRVDAYVQRSRARGSVRGAADGGCEFEHVLREEDVVVGDLLLTSGLGALYPKGLVIGRIASLERKPYGLFQVASIEPTVDFRQLEEVFVILEQGELPDDTAFSGDDEGLWIDAPVAKTETAEPEIPAAAAETP